MFAQVVYTKGSYSVLHSSSWSHLSSGKISVSPSLAFTLLGSHPDSFATLNSRSHTQLPEAPERTTVVNSGNWQIKLKA